MPSNNQIQYLRGRIASINRRLNGTDISDTTRTQLQRELNTLETELRDAEFIQQLADEACEIRGASNYLRNLDQK